MCVDDEPLSNDRVPLPLYDEYTGTFYLHHDWYGPDEVTDTILEAIELITGSLPADSELWEYVDGDALDRVFRPLPGGGHRDTGSLSFDYDDITITVYGTGDIEIEPEPPFIVDTDLIELVH